MATRGYFLIRNDDDAVQPYQTKRDLFIESYHDGYRDTMLTDVMLIPFRLAEMLDLVAEHAHKTSYSTRLSSKFVADGYFFRRADGRDDIRPKTWADVLSSNQSLGFFEITWSSVIELLQYTVPFQYMEVDPGVVRYGRPVSADEAEFTILSSSDRPDGRRADLTTITLHHRTLQDLADAPGELEDLAVEIAGLNDLIENEEAKISFDPAQRLISFSITLIALDQMWQSSRRRYGANHLQQTNDRTSISAAQ